MQTTHRSRARRATRGSVTAETAAVLPALVAVLAAALWLIQAIGAQLECVDAARAAARAAARGEPLADVQELARAATQPDALINVDRGPELTRVQITVRVRPAWGLPLPPATVEATAVSATEP
jgi:Flp pilus assembly protein TadG